ncbi:MAG: DUF3999 domain-containing protein [Planctomycetes bacterium]|nr:DUF3999 domain-containing protein [Planctomycetota bacterium]
MHLPDRKPGRLPGLHGACATWAFAAVALLAAAPARGDFDPEAWRVVREIRVQEGAAGGMARAFLDPDVFDKSAGPDLPDLRLIRGQADDIGYAVFVPREALPQVVRAAARVFNIAKRGQEATELVLDLGEGPPITNRIHVRTAARDFGCAVTVEGSDENKTWKTIRKDAAIFDFGGDIQRQFTTIAIPDTRMRYLRVIVAAPPNAGPIDLDGADVFQEKPPERGDLPAAVVLQAESRTDDQQMRETHVTLDLGARHLPAHSVTLVTPQRNFSRHVRVEVSDDMKRWRPAGGGTVFRFTEKYREERLTVTFPEAFGRYVCLRIDNGDDPPLPITHVEVQGRPRYLYFPLEAGKQYRLFYGNPDARSPHYEYAAVFEKSDRRAAVEARLGDPQANPRFIPTRAAAPPPPWLVQNQWALYAALAVVVAALGLIALRALRQPQEAQPPAGG